MGVSEEGNLGVCADTQVNGWSSKLCFFFLFGYPRYLGAVVLYGSEKGP